MNYLCRADVVHPYLQVPLKGIQFFNIHVFICPVPVDVPTKMLPLFQYQWQTSKYFLFSFSFFLLKEILFWEGSFFWFSSEQFNVCMKPKNCLGFGVPVSYRNLVGLVLGYGQKYGPCWTYVIALTCNQREMFLRVCFAFAGKCTVAFWIKLTCRRFIQTVRQRVVRTIYLRPFWSRLISCCSTMVSCFGSWVADMAKAF